MPPRISACDCDLDAYLKEQDVPGLCGVDTRELTRIIREHGVMNAAICSGIPADLDAGEDLRCHRRGGGRHLPASPPYTRRRGGAVPGRFAGLRRQAQHRPGASKPGLHRYGACRRQSPAEEILAAKPRRGHALQRPRGPGGECLSRSSRFKSSWAGCLCSVSAWAISSRPWLRAAAPTSSSTATGASNQPVRDLDGTRTYITSQNHGYAVDSDTVKLGRVRFANANDGTCEGIDYPDLRAFTVQFHPEACTGPQGHVLPL